MGKVLQLARDDSGQAVVEYILMVATVISISTIIAVGFRKTLFALWGYFTKQVSAAGPGAPAAPEFRPLK